MTRRIFFSFGIVAVLVYAGAVITGGILRPGYDHLSMAVSELIAAGSPNKPLLDGLFIGYNGLLILFAWAFGMCVRGEGRGLSVAGTVMLAVVGVLGLAMTIFFPMDTRGSAATLPGTIHLVLAGVLSLGSLLSILFVALGSRDHDAYWVYSLVSFFLVLLTGAAAAYTASQASPWLGLAERLTIGLFLVWVFVTSVRLVRLDIGRYDGGTP